MHDASTDMNGGDGREASTKMTVLNTMTEPTATGTTTTTTTTRRVHANTSVSATATTKALPMPTRPRTAAHHMVLKSRAMHSMVDKAETTVIQRIRELRELIALLTDMVQVTEADGDNKNKNKNDTALALVGEPNWRWRFGVRSVEEELESAAQCLRESATRTTALVQQLRDCERDVETLRSVLVGPSQPQPLIQKQVRLDPNPEDIAAATSLPSSPSSSSLDTETSSESESDTSCADEASPAGDSVDIFAGNVRSNSNNSSSHGAEKSNEEEEEEEANADEATTTDAAVVVNYKRQWAVLCVQQEGERRSHARAISEALQREMALETRLAHAYALLSAEKERNAVCTTTTTIHGGSESESDYNRTDRNEEDAVDDYVAVVITTEATHDVDSSAEAEGNDEEIEPAVLEEMTTSELPSMAIATPPTMSITTSSDGADTMAEVLVPYSSPAPVTPAADAVCESVDAPSTAEEQEEMEACGDTDPVHVTSAPVTASVAPVAAPTQLTPATPTTQTPRISRIVPPKIQVLTSLKRRAVSSREEEAPQQAQVEHAPPARTGRVPSQPQAPAPTLAARPLAPGRAARPPTGTRVPPPIQVRTEFPTPTRPQHQIPFWTAARAEARIAAPTGGADTEHQDAAPTATAATTQPIPSEPTSTTAETTAATTALAAPARAAPTTTRPRRTAANRSTTTTSTPTRATSKSAATQQQQQRGWR